MTLVADRVRLTIPPSYVARHVAEYFQRNEEHLKPWSPDRPDGFRTEQFWVHRLEKDRLEFLRGRSLRLTMFQRQEPLYVIGLVQLMRVVRGPLHAAVLGYHLDRQCEGRGFMTEALRAVIRYAFDEMNLHRIAANYVPENERSARLLERLGFAKEGYAPAYLRMNGVWRDHVLTAITNPNWKAI